MCGAQNEKTISFTHEEDGELYDCEAVLAYEAKSGKSNSNTKSFTCSRWAKDGCDADTFVTLTPGLGSSLINRNSNNRNLAPRVIMDLSQYLDYI